MCLKAEVCEQGVRRTVEAAESQGGNKLTIYRPLQSSGAQANEPRIQIGFSPWQDCTVNIIHYCL